MTTLNTISKIPHVVVVILLSFLQPNFSTKAATVEENLIMGEEIKGVLENRKVDPIKTGKRS
ncbi:MAG: hypothetical protein WBN45_11175, partial [Arenicellales bacterium]